MFLHQSNSDRLKKEALNTKFFNHKNLMIDAKQFCLVKTAFHDIRFSDSSAVFHKNAKERTIFQFFMPLAIIKTM